MTPIVELGRLPGAVPGSMTKYFADWLLALVQRASTVAQAVATLALTGKSSALGLTSLVTVATGVYRVSYRLRVSTPASTSSSLSLSVVTTEGGVVCTQTSAALASNVANVPLSGVFVVHADPSTPIQVSAAYTSVGTPMVWQADIVAEQVAS